MTLTERLEQAERDRANMARAVARGVPREKVMNALASRCGPCKRKMLDAMKRDAVNPEPERRTTWKTESA